MILDLKSARWPFKTENPYLNNQSNIGYFAVPKLTDAHKYQPDGTGLSIDNRDRIAFLGALHRYATKTNFTEMPKWLKVRLDTFKGSANCRCCGTPVGASELIVKTSGSAPIGIPTGYEHTLSHQIAPDPKLDLLIEHINKQIVTEYAKSVEQTVIPSAVILQFKNGHSYKLPLVLVQQALDAQKAKNNSLKDLESQKVADQSLDL